MWHYRAALIGLWLPSAAIAQTPQPPIALHANYQTFAAGLPIAEVQAGFSFEPRTYQMNLGFHTTGVIGLFVRGHQLDHVYGAWDGHKAVPTRFLGKGVWHGEDRLADIAYQQGRPIIRGLLPPNVDEREPVPEAQQANTIDTVSALAELIHAVDQTGRCETTVHTYDGRLAAEVVAHTAGEEVLIPTTRSTFAGKALRCDFVGHMVAGFRLGDNRERDAKPVHGSAWLASVEAGGPPVPVRMTFETRWFGDATMYLTGVGPGAEITVAGGN